MGIPFAETCVIRRYTAAIADGVVAHTLAEELELQGTITPVSERELEVMPEGLRSKAVYTFRSETNLNPGDQGGTDTWRLVIAEQEYLLTSFGRWVGANFGSLRHWKYAAVAMEE